MHCNDIIIKMCAFSKASKDVMQNKELIKKNGQCQRIRAFLAVIDGPDKNYPNINDTVMT